MNMRNLLLSFIFISLFTLPALSQEVEREMVVLEIVTGTWCQYCPAAANGAMELIENGHDVAVIKYHGGDSYEIPSSTARINYYGVTGYPTSKFDGVLTHSGGGGASSSNYNAYLPLYEQRKAIPSAYTIDVTGTHSGLIDFEVNIDMAKVADDDNSNIKLHAVITESDIEEFWQGMDHLHYVERAMVPSSSGTNVDFSDNTEQNATLNFSIDDDWVVENCELVVFLQNNSTKEILQGKKLELTALPGANACDMALTEIHNIPESNCDGTIAPVIEAMNYGSDDITSFTVEYTINGTLYTHEWEGTLSTMETVEVPLPEVTFEVLETNTIQAEIVNPNNQTDEFEENNAQSDTFTDGETTTTTVELLLRTDDNPEETTWEILNSTGDVIASGGPYADANSWVEMYTEFNLPPNDCYAFIIYDEGGDGLTDGNGLVKLVSSDDIEIVNMNTVNFGYADETQFYGSSGTSIDDPLAKSSLDVYPNPAGPQVSVNLNLSKSTDATFSLFDAFGKKVYSSDSMQLSAGENIKVIQTGNLESGLYLLRVHIGNRELKQSVIIR